MPKAKTIINDANHAVEEFLEGLLLQYPNQLVKLSNHAVVLAASPPADCVQLLSGGGTGHEPSHAGWIGHGMLSGAICGGMFASPSVAAIIAAIRAAAETNQRQGCLLVVKNYTGDRLNFGLACEMANQEGIPCRMVVVADDCALPRQKGVTGARGLAGTVLVHKVAGAAAAKGKSLDDIVQLANEVNGRIGTLGVALETVTIPGAATVNTRLNDETIEIGLGIHGEAGIKQSALLKANDMADVMIKTIREHGREITDPTSGETTIEPMFKAGDDLCVLVNNLGGTSNFEMSILANACVKALESSTYGCNVSRVLVGSYMTSFGMQGASLTVLNLTGASSELVECLDADCSAPAWNKCDVFARGTSSSRPSAVPRPEVVVTSKEEKPMPPLTIESFNSVAKTMATVAADKLSAEEPLLTKYDQIVGDGDCGTTMERGANAILEGIQSGTISLDHPVPFFADIASTVSNSMGGTSGALIEVFFRKMSSHLSSCSSIGGGEFCQAFQEGVDAICLIGGATVGSRTMLDALIPAAQALVTSANLGTAAEQAKLGAEGTAKMNVASAGRSNYLSSEQLKGTPDPGAMAVAIVLGALASQAQ
eukprot:Nitzschia sp. Nitz4//scaffold2_size372955//29228//31018//NITZ4_000360-RA/size372955-exonerate_protein2genome-gene-0.235-mRNA-1//1//CDS//3329546587//7556//frame0